MARVVQRRTPPYLLIVFVILFVFSTVIGVLFFNKYNTAEEKLKAHLKDKPRLISREQERRTEIKAMAREYEQAKAKRVPGLASKTVVGRLMEQISRLTNDITGSPNTTFAAAREQIKRIAEDVNMPSSKGLVAHLKDVYAQLEAKQGEIDKLGDEAKQRQIELVAAQDALKVAKADLEAEQIDKHEQIAALESKFKSAETKHAAKIKEHEKIFNEAIDGSTKRSEAQAALRKIDQATIAMLWGRIRDFEKKLTPGVIDTKQIVRRPDGKVNSVVADRGVVYLGIGAKDRVTEGLRFTVFPFTGVDPKGKGKGVVEVHDVSDNVCEARIIFQNKDNPIIPGDIVANLVYDAIRNYKFLVEGNFDIDDTGNPTPAGNKAVKDIVRRYGGTVVDELSVATAFVVLGDQPGEPRKPDDTDPPDAWSLYTERLKGFNRYKAVKAQAEALKIPLINSARFLDLVGYIPSKITAGR